MSRYEVLGSVHRDGCPPRSSRPTVKSPGIHAGPQPVAQTEPSARSPADANGAPRARTQTGEEPKRRIGLTPPELFYTGLSTDVSGDIHNDFHRCYPQSWTAVCGHFSSPRALGHPGGTDAHRPHIRSNASQTSIQSVVRPCRATSCRYQLRNAHLTRRYLCHRAALCGAGMSVSLHRTWIVLEIARESVSP